MQSKTQTVSSHFSNRFPCRARSLPSAQADADGYVYITDFTAYDYTGA